MKKYFLLFFLMGTVVMMFVMDKTGAPLKTAGTPHGIIDLEFAYNTVKTAAVINAWLPTVDTDNINAAKINTYYDFLFLFFYSFLLFFAGIIIAQAIRGWLAKAGNIIAKAGLLAGFFDILENTGMLLTLNDNTSTGIAFLTASFSVIKWILAIIAVLYVLTGALVWTYHKFMN